MRKQGEAGQLAHALGQLQQSGQRFSIGIFKFQLDFVHLTGSKRLLS